MIIINSKEQFDQDVIKAEAPVMADFYADWCGPCRALAPLLEAMDKEINTCSIAKINVDSFPEIAQEYNVSSIPTILVFKNGECVQRSVGLVSREELEKMIPEV